MAKRHERRELLTLLRKLLEQGWSVTETARGHFRCRAPSGAVVFAGGSGDWRALHNSRSLLRRNGAKV